MTVVDLGPGAELAQHARLRIDIGVQVYFCDPHGPWQRGTNENAKRLLRQYLNRAGFVGGSTICQDRAMGTKKP